MRRELVKLIAEYAERGATPSELVLDTPCLFDELNDRRERQALPPFTPTQFRRAINRAVFQTTYFKSRNQQYLSKAMQHMGRRKWGFQVMRDAVRARRRIAKTVDQIPAEMDFPELTAYYHAFSKLKELGHCNLGCVRLPPGNPVERALSMLQRVQLVHNNIAPLSFGCYPVDYLAKRSPALFCNDRFRMLTSSDHTKEFHFLMGPECGNLVLHNVLMSRPGEVVSFGKIRILQINRWSYSFGIAVGRLLFMWGFTLSSDQDNLLKNPACLYQEVPSCLPATKVKYADATPEAMPARAKPTPPPQPSPGLGTSTTEPLQHPTPNAPTRTCKILKPAPVVDIPASPEATASSVSYDSSGGPAVDCELALDLQPIAEPIVDNMQDPDDIDQLHDWLLNSRDVTLALELPGKYGVDHQSDGVQRVFDEPMARQEHAMHPQESNPNESLLLLANFDIDEAENFAPSALTPARPKHASEYAQGNATRDDLFLEKRFMEPNNHSADQTHKPNTAHDWLFL